MCLREREREVKLRVSCSFNHWLHICHHPRKHSSYKTRHPKVPLNHTSLSTGDPAHMLNIHHYKSRDILCITMFKNKTELRLTSTENHVSARRLAPARSVKLRYRKLCRRLPPLQPWSLHTWSPEQKERENHKHLCEQYVFVFLLKTKCFNQLCHLSRLKWKNWFIWSQTICINVSNVHTHYMLIKDMYLRLYTMCNQENKKSLCLALHQQKVHFFSK